MPAKIGLSGDLMSHLGFVILEYEGQDYDDFFSPAVRRFCASQHEMWGNLEGPATKSDDALGVYRIMAAKHRRSPKLFFLRRQVQALRRLNYSVLGVANNHSFDFENPHDTAETASILHGLGIEAPGLSFEPVIREIEGISFAIIATTCHLNSPHVVGGEVAYLSRETFPALRRVVRLWKQKVDYVIVLTHWGQDYEPQPRSSIRALAKALLDAGVNVVYGNHPHILWPIEQPSASQLICYSLGNFSQLIGCPTWYPKSPVFRKALHGGLVSLEFSSSGITASFQPVRTHDNFDSWLTTINMTRSYWIWTAKDINEWLRSLKESRPRLWSRVELSGPSGPLPSTLVDVELQYPAALRPFMYETG